MPNVKKELTLVALLKRSDYIEKYLALVPTYEDELAQLDRAIGCFTLPEIVAARNYKPQKYKPRKPKPAPLADPTVPTTPPVQTQEEIDRAKCKKYNEPYDFNHINEAIHYLLMNDDKPNERTSISLRRAREYQAEYELAHPQIKEHRGVKLTRDETTPAPAEMMKRKMPDVAAQVNFKPDE